MHYTLDIHYDTLKKIEYNLNIHEIYTNNMCLYNE